MQDPPVLEVCTDADRKPKHERRVRCKATVRFGSQSRVDLVHLSAPNSSPHVQRWRRIGNPAKLIAKVLMLDSAVGAANTNLPARQAARPRPRLLTPTTPQRDETKQRYQMVDQQLLEIGKVEKLNGRSGGTITDQFGSGDP